MLLRTPLLALIFTLYFTSSQGQDQRSQGLFLKSGFIQPANNINDKAIQEVNSQLDLNSGFCILQFEHLLSPAERKLLEQQGISFVEYIPEKAYLVRVNKQLDLAALKNSKARAVILIKPSDKISPLIKQSSDTGSIQVVIAVFKGLEKALIMRSLIEHNFQVISADLDNYTVNLKIPSAELLNLARLDFVQYIEPVFNSTESLNFLSVPGSRGNVAQSNAPGGYGLSGEGVSVFISEVDGYPQGHIDFVDRLIEGKVSTSSNYHSTHVHGIAGGAGNIDERFKGFAPKVRILSGTSLNAWADMVSRILTYDITLTNNSWPSGAICTPQGYFISTSLYDRLSVEFPSLLHVFAAGNSGQSTCPGYPTGYNTVYGWANTAKNVITVGNTLNTGEFYNVSSMGPAPGGRLKPDIMATGTLVWSTVPNNTYFTNTGTSMSSPAVMGGLALLYQRYKQLHNGVNPKGGLMKAILCNSATDIGNPGPDFSFGFGWMNLNRALQLIDKNNYFDDSIGFDGLKTHTISVPSNTAQVKIMLYWHDPATSANVSKALINDLDLVVSTPAGNKVLPLVLDTLPSLVQNTAREGEDHINNTEQVVIDHPQAGNYVVRVKGNAIPLMDQVEYFVAYDIVPNEIQLTYPFGGEGLVQNDELRILWDAWGDRSSGFNLEFSPDGGSSWQLINQVASDQRLFNWHVPSVATDKARIRITRIADNKTSTSGDFVILGCPQAVFDAIQCPRYIAMHWDVIPSATDYEVMMVREGQMKHVAFTNDTNYVFRNLSEDSTWWVTVRARLNGKPGRRGFAIFRKPDSGNCSGTISDNDILPDALLTPTTGRKFTSTALSSQEKIRVRVTNLDDQAMNGFTIQFSVNNGNWVTENSNASIPANGSVIHEFNSVYDFSAAGNYTVRVVAMHAGDVNHLNDTLTVLVRHIDNQPLNLNQTVSDNFQNAEERKYKTSYIGLTGAERFDYSATRISQELSILKDLTGNKFLRIGDYDPDFVQRFTEAVIATYNLSAYDTATSNIALGLMKRRSSPDTVWVRGNDTAQWLPLEITPFQNSAVWRDSEELEIDDVLKKGHQNFSSSVQLKWETDDFRNIIDLDSIRIHSTSNDLQLLSIDSVRSIYWASNTPVPVRVSVRNASHNNALNVKVYYKLDNGNPVSETIQMLPANTTMVFDFSSPVIINQLGEHLLEAWIEYAPDSYQENNRKTLAIHNQPIITDYPFLEDFESSKGSWYAEGANNSWEYGKPNGVRISRAASGGKAWKTKLNGTYSVRETGYLYTPVFDLTKLKQPYLSFSLALNTDDVCGSFACDALRMEYSVNGKDWVSANLTNNSSYNWSTTWVSKIYNRWHVVTTGLRNTIDTVQFRFLFSSANYVVVDGAAIDDFHVYDSIAPIHALPQETQIVQTLSGNNWVPFTENGKIVAAINPKGQDLGTTTVKGFLNSGGVRNFHGQYYLDRSFMIQPGKPLQDSVAVRFYFLDKETDSVVLSQTCNSCIRPVDAYRFGISSYRSERTSEINGKVQDDVIGQWTFTPFSKVRVVPFDRGYYAEFKIKDGGEFWLNNGGFFNNSYLPTELSNFSISKTNSGINLSWTTGAEINIDHFEIEIAKDQQAFEQGLFVKTAEVKSKGRSPQAQQYSYSDQSDKGIIYYRLKLLDIYGNAAYSQVISVGFSNEMNWELYPNPSARIFYLRGQAESGKTVSIEVFDAVGRMVKKQEATASGFVQEIPVDMGPFANGFYSLKLSAGSGFQVLKMMKN